MTQERAYFLLSMGAIYLNGERTLENNLLQKNDLIRCHTEPRRFRMNIDWNKHILFENQDFIVIDKPPGLPCQASLDNKIENLLYLLSEKCKQNLLITHRLDVGTEGFIVLAKNKLFQKTFNHLLETREVIKIYECLTTGPQLTPGRLTHWMLPHPRAPKILSNTYGEREAKERWKHCELEILNSEIINLKSFSHAPLSSGFVNCYRLQLHTGRTHQIRAQLSFESNPIVGDQLYGGQIKDELTDSFRPSNDIDCEPLSTEVLQDPTKPTLLLEQYALRCCELKFHYQGQSFVWQLPRFKSLTTKS